MCEHPAEKAPMRDYIIKGNYLDPTGEPVIATRMPHPDDTNAIGDGRSWVARWIRACDDVTVFAHENGGFQWDHGTTRHVLDSGAFVVWTGIEYRTVAPDEFAETYPPVDLPTRVLSPVDPDDLCLSCGATNDVCRCPIPPGATNERGDDA